MDIFTAQWLKQRYRFIGLPLIAILTVMPHTQAFAGAESDALGGGPAPVSTEINPASLEVVRNNVRYKPSPDDPGNIDCFNVYNNEKLRTVKIYNTITKDDPESGAKPVYMKAMTLQDDGTILIENKRGDRFVYNTNTRSVRSE